MAAGPVGRQTSTSTDISFKAEIYSYARSRGLFAGVSVDGAAMTIDKKANAAYYPNSSGDAMEIMTDANLVAPPAAQRFVDTLSAAAPQVDMDGPAGGAAVKTYAIDEPATAEVANTF